MLDFPNNPTTGQQWIGSNGALYTWDGVVWALTSPTAGSFQWMDTGSLLEPIRSPTYPISCGNVTVLGSNLSSPTLVFQNLRAGNAATQFPDSIFGAIAAGYDGAAQRVGGYVNVQAAETWSPTARGCSLYIATTRAGAATQGIRLGITADGNTYFDNLTGLRVGDATQVAREMLDVKGAAVLGPSANATPVDGTLQWTGSTFQGRIAGAWVDIPGQAILTGPAGGSLTGSYPNPGIANGAIGPAQLASTVAALPPWNGAADAGKTPIVQTNGTIAWATITATGAAGGSLTGTYPNPTIATNAIGTAMIANSTITDAKITGMAYSKLTGAPAIPTTLPPTGAAGGDLTGSYPNPTLTAAAHSKWTDFGPLLTPNVGTKQIFISGPTSGDLSQLQLGPNNKCAIGQIPNLNYSYISMNAYFNGAWQQYTNSITGWFMFMDSTNNQVGWQSIPAGGGANGVRLYIDTGGNLYITGNAFKPGGGAWVASSDDTVKKDVAPYTAGLAEILQLEPITYQYNGTGKTIEDGVTYHGLSAQAVLPVMPEMVSKDSDGLYNLNTSPLIFAIINAIKELAARG